MLRKEYYYYKIHPSLTKSSAPPPSIDYHLHHFYKKILIPPSTIFQKSQSSYKEGESHYGSDISQFILASSNYNDWSKKEENTKQYHSERQGLHICPYITKQVLVHIFSIPSATLAYFICILVIVTI